MNKLNILFVDLETLPNIVYNWKTGFDIQIPTEFIIQEREIFCIGFKWAGKRNTVKNFFRKPGVSERDILRKFSKVAAKADIIIGHNGDNFDIKWLKSRNMILNLPPLPPIKSIDTLKLARSNFTLNSNKLGYLADILGIGRKTDTGGMQLWKDVMARKPEAIKHMVRYCNNDVILLEKIFNRIAPHVTKLPINKGVIETGSNTSCPSCGSKHTHKRGFTYTVTKRYQRRQCKKCFKYFQAELVK